MLLNMGERIRELRRERALTQDEVARRLNISAQAVSKWENSVSYPDLEMIPPLAELPGVSIDALFREDAGSEAEDCCRQADALLLTPARAKEALPMLREAVIRRSFHAGLLGRLGTALYLAYRLPENLGQTEINEQGEETVVTHGDPALLREAAAVWERVLNCEQQPDSRDGVVKSLISAYALMGQQEKARELAQRQNRLAYAREILLVDAEEGVRKEEAVANALLALFIQTAQTLLQCTPGVNGILTEADDDLRLLQAQRCPPRRDGSKLFSRTGAAENCIASCRSFTTIPPRFTPRWMTSQKRMSISSPWRVTNRPTTPTVRATLTATPARCLSELRIRSRCISNMSPPNSPSRRRIGSP